MKTDPLKAGALPEDSAGANEHARKQAQDSAVERAVNKGRIAQEASKSAQDKAERELTGEPEKTREYSAQESAAESEGWGVAFGSSGHKVPVPSGDDEDDEGRSDTERLVVKGVRDAGREQRREADREAQKNS
jgi:hypothetical protein